MRWPTSQDYNEAVQGAAACLSDPELKGGSVAVNAIGLPVPRSGNFADVYQFHGADGRMWAVKCFTRHVEGLQERYARINEYLARADLPFTVQFTYLAEGIRIRGDWFPLLKMEWVEGFTLNEFVRQNAEKPTYLQGLLQMWGKLAGRLREANIAHADLQHGNVLLVPGNTPSKLGLKLIDYDGMWVPPLADHHSGEVGHPNFQHPLRLKDRLFNADVDRFPHLVIACALRATLVDGKRLWEEFDNGDNLLFREQDLHDPAASRVFRALWDLNDGLVRALVGHIVLSSRQPLRKTPWLDDLLLEEGGPRLSANEESQASALLGIGASSAATVVVPAEVSAFEAIDDEAGEPPPPRARKDKKSKLPWFIGGGALALALIGALFAIGPGKSKEGPAPQVAQNDSQDEGPKSKRPAGGKKDPSGDQQTAIAPKKGSASNDSDRRAAEYVLSIGGSVILKGRFQEIKSVADLPRDHFSMVGVVLSGNRKMTETGMAVFQECRDLEYLQMYNSAISDAMLANFKNCINLGDVRLSGSPVTDAGMMHLKDCKKLAILELGGMKLTDEFLILVKGWKNLGGLYINNTQVTDAGMANFEGRTKLHSINLTSTKVGDAGLAYLQNCKDLGGLYIAVTQVTDAGLAYFKDCKNLEHLDLNVTKVTSSGLANFRDCPKLHTLWLAYTQVDDEGLAHFKICKNLARLDLNGTKVTDEGLANFKDCTNLVDVRLDNTRIGDAGLVHLHDCKKLGYILLKKSKVTATGIDDLKKALPYCRIEWDGGLINPKK